MTFKSSRGFTLIELLVVVAIISLLSSVVLASLREAREKAEISKLTSELREVQKAIELYYSTAGSYPPANPAGGGQPKPLNSVLTDSLSNYIKSITTPSFVYDAIGAANGSRIMYATRATRGSYTCNNNINHEYFLIFRSTKVLPAPFKPASYYGGSANQYCLPSFD